MRDQALGELRRLASTLQECGAEAACERLLQRVAAAKPVMLLEVGAPSALRGELETER